MAPTFSIISIVYNDLSGLLRTERSVLSQLDQDFEWIVVDGASSDGTVEYLTSIEFKGSFYSEPDDGIADAWNKGISAAKGDYILILNAGDTISASFLSEYRKHLVKDKILCSHSSVITESGRDVGTFSSRPRSLWRGMTIPHLTCLVHRSMYEDYGLYRLLCHSMDYDWFLMYYRRKGPTGFKVINVNLSQFYLGGQSSTQYIDSFRANRDLMIEHGFPKIQAYIISYIMISKHALTRDGF